jgi:hypothetical protein
MRAVFAGIFSVLLVASSFGGPLGALGDAAKTGARKGDECSKSGEIAGVSISF